MISILFDFAIYEKMRRILDDVFATNILERDCSICLHCSETYMKIGCSPLSLHELVLVVQTACACICICLWDRGSTCIECQGREENHRSESGHQTWMPLRSHLPLCSSTTLVLYLPHYQGCQRTSRWIDRLSCEATIKESELMLT